MPIRAILVDKIIAFSCGIFTLIGSGHYDVSKSELTVHKTPETVVTTSVTETTKSKQISLTATTISVSCIKLEWNCKTDTQYTVTAVQSENNDYIDNMYFEFKSNSLCYVTGLRENSEYTFKIADEDGNVLGATVQRTEAVEVIQEFDYIDGWTNCFAYEKASGLTRNPSYSAIQGAVPDPITNTGIMRNEYGDYCCAMGTFFGYCGDRFLITLENGTQFTVKICDSKGDRVYHPFGGDGKCIVEFIHADGCLPSCVAFSGNYGSYNWCGLNFDNIQSIKKISYGNPVEY